MNPLKQEPDAKGREAGACQLMAEEKLVDYVMGHLADAEKERIAGHLGDCPTCNRTVREWMEMLPSPPIPRTSPLSVGLQEMGTEKSGCLEPGIRGQQGHGVYPGQRLRRKLMFKASIRFARLKLKSHRKRIAGGLAAAFALVLVLGLFGLPESGTKQAPTMEKIIHDRIADLQQYPGTEKFMIQPLNRLYDSGSVWIRRESGEMLIVVDGLNTLAEQDYRVWLQDEKRLELAGILIVNDRKGPSYYYGYGAGKTNKIVVSMEPKGGGRIPTRPEAVLVEMNLPLK